MSEMESPPEANRVMELSITLGMKTLHRHIAVDFHVVEILGREMGESEIKTASAVRKSFHLSPIRSVSYLRRDAKSTPPLNTPFTRGSVT